MEIDDYKERIVTLTETSKDTDYIIALYSFAEAYPDHSKTDSSNSD